MNVLHIADEANLLRWEQSHSLIFLHERFNFADAEIVFIEISFPLFIRLILVYLFIRFDFIHFGELFKGFCVSEVEGFGEIRF